MASRAENRRTTLLRLGDAAVELYESMNPSEPTVEQIAARAGVSRRTAFRYVGRKEELAFTRPLLWFDDFDAAIAADPDAPIRARLDAGAEAVSRTIDADPQPVRRGLEAMRRTPALAVGYNTVSQLWIDRVEAEFSRDDSADPFRSRVIATAYMGVIDAALAAWMDNDTSLAEHVQRGLDILAPLYADRV